MNPVEALCIGPRTLRSPDIASNGVGHSESTLPPAPLNYQLQWVAGSALRAKREKIAVVGRICGASSILSMTTK